MNISGTIINNGENFIKEIEDKAFNNFREVAMVFRDAVRESLNKQALTPNEHALPGFPRVKHTGDLQSSVRYAVLQKVDGDFYSIVFIAIDYGQDYEDRYPVLEPVFNKYVNDAVEALTTSDITGLFLVPEMYAIRTETYFGRSYEREEPSYQYPALPSAKRMVKDY